MRNGRYFELTIGVHLFESEELPVTFRDWIERMGLCHEGASPTTLNHVVELRQPPSVDIIERRKEQHDKHYVIRIY